MIGTRAPRTIPAAYALAIKLNPRRASTFIARGAFFAKQGQYARAIKDFDQAITIDPNNPDAFEQRAYATAMNGDNKGAHKDLDTALKLDPKRVSALLGRGTHFVTQRKYDRAIQDFVEQLALIQIMCGRALRLEWQL